MKLLLYCTKNNRFKRLCRSNDLPVCSGHIVASCECNLVEEIVIAPSSNYDNWDTNYIRDEALRTNRLIDEDLVSESCLDIDDLEEYFGIVHNENWSIKDSSFKGGYALHLENVKAFDKPKELSDYGLKKAPQNMCYVTDENGEKCILLSIRPEYLLKIISGEKTIEIRKRIVKELKVLLFHETLRVILEQLGLKEESESDNEDLINVFATILLEVLK